jgi:hypothetical protein
LAKSTLISKACPVLIPAGISNVFSTVSPFFNASLQAKFQRPESDIGKTTVSFPDSCFVTRISLSADKFPTDSNSPE